MNDETSLTSVRETRGHRRRSARAERELAKTFSPVNLLIRIIFLPLTVALVAFGVYLRTSPYSPAEAALHLVPLAGCEAAKKFGLAPAQRGGLGYHSKNDPDGDGIACDAGVLRVTAPSNTTVPDRSSTGAKFVRP
ncbi:excalibur calcium-binding domain-containing protein [Aestuariibius sp. 2305UL40-4]|uniref:excalibur calcium-binding domain-containing protein n=1 Tax=Aestuariibius violaceus TaxID=3234132 RepID=UPI00345E2F36